MRCLRSGIARICAMVALVSPVASPQASTATVSGTTRDQTGAVVPEAAVTLTNKNTNITSKAATNESGFFVFPGTLPGPYSLTVEKPGMQKFEGSLLVQVQQSAVVNITLRVGQTATEVSVQDVTPLLQVPTPRWAMCWSASASSNCRSTAAT